MTQWTRCDAALPPLGVSVLVVVERRPLTLNIVCRTEPREEVDRALPWCWRDRDGLDFFPESYTHWMPLPELPQ